MQRFSGTELPKDQNLKWDQIQPREELLGGRLVHVKGNLRTSKSVKSGEVKENQKSKEVFKGHLVSHEGIGRGAPAEFLKDVCHFQRLFQEDETLAHLETVYVLNCSEAKQHLDIVWSLQTSVEPDKSFEQLASEIFKDELKLRFAITLHL